MPEEILSERKKRILCAVINDYIHTAFPVGSKTIARLYNIGFSPATVRNIMAELEDMGYLVQPHTSAGRVPTDKGFRFYVDTLLELRRLNRYERERIKNWYRLEGLDIEEVMKETSRILSLFSSYMGVVLAPKLIDADIKRIEFILIKKGYVLVVLIATSGILYNRIVDIEERVTQEDLDRMSNFLNRIVSGLTLREVKKRIIGEMEEEKNVFDRLLVKALEIGKTAVIDAERKEDLYIDGRTNIFGCPEFRDMQKMKALFKAFEEKGVLIRILDECLNSDGVQIFIGSENEHEEMKECSVVAIPYNAYGNIFGTLGVIGPMRMDYSKIIPLVEYTAELVGGMLEMRNNL